MMLLAVAAATMALYAPAAEGARPGEAAPELAEGAWINSAPLTMAALRGRVVLVEFWTYG